MSRYWAFKNAWSMDQLPGMKRGLAVAKAENVAPMKKMVGPLAPKEYRNSTSAAAIETRTVLLVVLGFLLGFLFATWRPQITQDLRLLVDKHGL